MLRFPRRFQKTVSPVWIWLNPLFSILFSAGAVAIFARSYPVIGLQPETMIDPLALVIALVYPVLGAFIAGRQPSNPIAWLFCVMGLVAGFYQFSMQYAVLSYRVLPDPLPLAAWMSWVQSWAWFIPLNFIVLVVFLYPNGRLLTPRWKSIFWAVAAAVPLLIFITLLYLWPHRGPFLFLPDAQLPAPVLADQQRMQSFWFPLIGLPLLLGLPAGVFSLVLRQRRAAPEERQQIKWFLYAGGLFATGLFVTLVIMMTAEESLLATLLWNLLLPVLAAMLPVVLAFAILRYRLFDIDWIIRRTLAYSVLTTILALIYFGSILLLQALLRAVTGSESTLAVVASTLLIAGLFTPLRGRIQRAIDRRFFRSRYSPETLVADLSAALQNEMDLNHMAASVLETVEEAVQPAGLSIWLLRKKPGAPTEDQGSSVPIVTT